MNLEELVRAALVEETKSEPDEAGGYERFLRRRRRRAVTVAASTGLAVALVLTLAVGGGLLVGGADRVAGPVEPAPTTAPPTTAPPGRAGAPVLAGSGGRGDYAWEKLVRKRSGGDYWTELRHRDGTLWYGGAYHEPKREEQQAMIHCAPSRDRATAMLVEGYGSTAVAKVRVELAGKAPVEVRTFRREEFPFAFWVVAPLPPDARPLSFTSFDAAGRQLARGTHFSGYPNCR